MDEPIDQMIIKELCFILNNYFFSEKWLLQLIKNTLWEGIHCYGEVSIDNSSAHYN